MNETSFVPSFPFSQLTIDLARSVFEESAEQDIHMARVLVLVSKTVKQWVDPILYRVIDVRADEEALWALRRGMRLRREPAFFRQAVKVVHYVALPYLQKRMKQLLTLIAACPNITTLLIPDDRCWHTISPYTDDERPTYTVTLELPNLTHYAVPLTGLPALFPAYPDRLTHLRIFCEYDPTGRHLRPKTRYVKALKKLTSLTHLALNIMLDKATLPNLQQTLDVLTLPPKIEVVVVELLTKNAAMRTVQNMTLHREYWENKNPPYVLSGEAVRDLLGLPVHATFEWPRRPLFPLSFYFTKENSGRTIQYHVVLEVWWPDPLLKRDLTASWNRSPPAI
ncbi:hypothetical protein CYLTODRAFT_493065, partial [Cylindrobasidium torrendii FP15055 ss-10]